MVRGSEQDPDSESTDIAPSVAAPSSIPGRFLLIVTDGPDRGASFSLDGSAPTRTLLGQSEACAIRLADSQVSRRHAALEVIGQTVRVTDLGSTNGTWIDRISVGEVRLRGGEVLRVGSTRIRVEPDGATSFPALTSATRFGRLLGASDPMRRLYPLCERLAASNVPVIIEGETGTGKEVLAESLHEQSARAAHPFVVFDCTSVSANLMESELFGHEKGAFTGATVQRKGLFELADGGTLLIDEIGDLDPALQPKLLRALERSEVRRIGGDRYVRADVRVIAATRRDLDREVQQGRFRDDLFHRLAVTRIELPPLRSRRQDVTLLASHFWTQLGGDGSPSPELLAKWEDSPWPGNVRELRNAVARQLAIGELVLAPASNPEPDPRVGEPQSATGADFIDGVVATGMPLVRGREVVVDEYERRYIESVLEKHNGNVVHAARASGIARRHFQRLRARTKGSG